METSIKNALNEEGLETRIPLTKKGKPKTSGYPDLDVMEKNGRRRRRRRRRRTYADKIVIGTSPRVQRT